MAEQKSAEGIADVNKYKPYAGFFITLGIAVLVYLGLTWAPHSGISFLPYSEVSARAGTNMFYKFIWFIEDFTNAQFYASVFAGLGLIAGAWIGYALNCRKKKSGGFVICYSHYIFPWVFAAQMLGLAISVLLYTPLLDSTEMGWIPTFIPFVSVPVIVIFTYGPNLSAVFTGSILTGLLATPMGTVLNKYVFNPAGLPVVSANVLTMCFLGILVLEVCRYVPWIDKSKGYFGGNAKAYGAKYAEVTPSHNPYKTSWFLRRVLADFTEAQFYGNEWASGLMILGVIIDWIIDPSHIYYGSNLVPIMLSACIVSSAVGVFVYHKHWTKGFYPTFTPVVTVVPGIVLIMGGDVFLSILSAVLGGLLAPPFAAMVTSRMPEGWHPMIGNTLSMTVCTALIAMVIKALPIIGIGI
jgi:hypothetical protein